MYSGTFSISFGNFNRLVFHLQNNNNNIKKAILRRKNAFPSAKKQQFGWACCVPPQPALLPGCLVCTWQQAPTASAYLYKNTPYLYESTFQITYLSFF